MSEPTAKRLMERLAELNSITRERRVLDGACVTLSTIHSSKGLEYDTVYLADVCDGIFPETIVLDPKSAEKETLAEYEEERRLFYVGATRAKNRLFVFSYAGKSSHFCDEFFGNGKKGI
jgi:DNA helicase-2/ATP-dependent DNA helicase PcrA